MARKISGTPATTALTAAGIEFALCEYQHDPQETDFGGEAARLLGVAPQQVFKTLVVAVDQHLAVAVVPVSGMLDLKAFASACGAKRAALAPAVLAERKTGYVLGGVSPIGQRTKLPTVIDQSAQGFDSVYVSAGKRGSDVRLRPEDLAQITAASWAEIARA